MTTKIFLLACLIGIIHMAKSANVAPISSRGLFAADLFKEISKSKINENVVFSPISVQTALAMAYLGAEGETAIELEKGLRLPSSDKKAVGESFAQILKENKGEAELDIANRIFVNAEYKLAKTFNELAQKYYQSEAENVDFKDSSKAIKTINDWVEQKTNKKITNVLQPGAVNGDTSALIVNAIYFKGKWNTPFSQHRTSKGKFWISQTESVEADLMQDEEKFKYGEFADLDATAIEMPYKDSDLSMLIILPKQRDGLAKLEEKLNSIAVNELSQKMKVEDVFVFVPKFKIEFSLPLVDYLKKLGIRSIFEEKANLSGLFESGPNVRVSDVQHKAYIEVNEAGSEAAAATVLKIVPTSLNLNQKTFNVDHPFVFAIKSADVVYFIGHIATF